MCLYNFYLNKDGQKKQPRKWKHNNEEIKIMCELIKQISKENIACL